MTAFLAHPVNKQHILLQVFQKVRYDLVRFHAYIARLPCEWPKHIKRTSLDIFFCNMHG